MRGKGGPRQVGFQLGQTVGPRLEGKIADYMDSGPGKRGLVGWDEKEGGQYIIESERRAVVDRLQAKANLMRQRVITTLAAVGIAEQNLIGIAAGMASSGLVPFGCGLAPFISMRAAEQIRTDVCYPKFNVRIAAMYAGVSRGIGGSTHHATEDLAILRSMANMAVVVPADATETYKAVLAALDYPGPVYLRLAANDPDPLVYREDYDFAIGKAVTLHEGEDVTIIACGQMVIFALWAAEALADEGIQARVLNVHTIKPIDREKVVAAARETGRIVTVEDHNVLGGLGSAVAEVVVAECPVPVRMLGIPDLYAAVGPTPDLWRKYGLTWENIAATARDLVRR